MKPILVASLVVLCLSACGGPSEEDVLTEEKIRASQSAPELPDIQLSDNPEPPPAPPPVEENLVANELENELVDNEIEPVADGPIPAAFQARWGTVPADCRPGEVLGNALVITPDTLMTGESVGRLSQVVGDYPERFVGMFEFDGQEREEQLVLTGSSNTLIRVSGGQRYAYHRCGAARPTG
ncbi:MAG TPA: hypothetical protein VFT40_10675 [Sphingomicrobium sp.]|jgi:hypothetical protein|nr:hypothetical protein [Sphingomicrobium sp.]